MPSRLNNKRDCSVVDVRRDDGLFQRGKIVDCVENGFMIDWGCKGVEPVFVRLDRAYLARWEHFRDLDAMSDGRTAVEVLRRPSHEEPLTWYPGTLVAVYFEPFGSFGLVESAVPDGPIVARGHRIRTRHTETKLQELRVQTDQFVQRTLALPSGYGRGAVSGYNLRSRLGDAAKTDQSMPQQRKRKLSKSVADLESSAEVEKCFELLHADVLFYVFDFLDSAEQCRLRRVSRNWDCMLKLPSLEHTLRVSYTSKRLVGNGWEAVLSVDKCQHYLSVASLHHSWTQHTKTIINAGIYGSRESLFCDGSLFRLLTSSELHARVERLVLADVMWSTGTNGFALQELGFSGAVGRFVEELNGFADACHTLVLRNVEAPLSRGALKCAYVRIVTGRITGGLTVKELWSRMDAGLPPLGHAQCQRVVDLIGSLTQRSKVLTVLNEIQSHDPRDDAEYRSEEWTEDNLATLQVEKLSKLTVYSLASLSGQKVTREFRISW